MYLLTILFVVYLGIDVFPDQSEYDVAKIPQQLLLDGGAVIRVNEMTFEIKDYKSAQLIVKYAVTIFNNDQQHFGTLKLWYDNFRSVDELDGAIYNSKGNLVRELTDDDIMDFSDFDGYSVYSDNRVKLAELYESDFPYTVEYIYELEYNGYLTWPTWYSRKSLDPVESSTFSVITPGDYNLRYWCNVDSIKPVVQISGDEKLYFWKEENLPKLSYDAVGEDVEEIALVVRIAPSEFEIDGHHGNMDSWESFGSWFYNLSREKDKLPESVKNEVAAQIESVQDQNKKIEILYRYMQSKTRYVSVQLGIGGWQPFDAEYVWKNGYGDCKALSNYMVSLLKYAGISAYPVLIDNGNFNRPLATEFPSNQFNHVIVCVPQANDTIWLECTSQVMPPGYVGSSNENRDALMVTPDGGVIVKTPHSNAESNLQLKNIMVNLSSSGSAKVISEILYFGNQYSYAVHMISNSTPEEKDKWIKNTFEVPDIQLQNFSFKEYSEDRPYIELQMEIELKRYAAVSGKRIFFNPNLMERRSWVPKDVPKRFSPVRFQYPYLDVDSIKYEIPKHYKVEAFPEEKNIHSSFGSFSSKTIVTQDNEILFVRNLEISSYSIPAESYNEYQKFFAEVVESDKQKIVLVKK